MLVISTEYWTIVIEDNGLILYNFYEVEKAGEVHPGISARTDESRQAVVQAVDTLLADLRNLR